MNICLFKLKFLIDQIYLQSEYEKLSDIERMKIDNLDISSSFEHGDDKCYYSYLLIDQVQMDMYLKILNENLIPYICKDISKEVMSGSANLEKILDPYLDYTNHVTFDGFIYDINKWIYSNLDVDSILDRISSNGISSLRPIEKEFLENSCK